MNEGSATSATLSLPDVRTPVLAADAGLACLRRWQLTALDWLDTVRHPRAPQYSEEILPSDVGVVGLSGMGKSTLLNALLAPGVQLLPAGGVSPLTSLAVRITYGHETSLRVVYRDRRWVHEGLRALRSERLPELERGRLSLACTADQYRIRDSDWLSAAIQYALNPDSRRPPDEQRETIDALHRLALAVERLGTSEVWPLSKSPSDFFAAVRDHTCGQFAPLCRSVELSVNAPLLLTGATLIDLPGIGSVSDSHAATTYEFLRTAPAILLVVDRAGLPDSVLEAFQRSGFMERWLSGDAEWLIAVTKLDLVADDARRADCGRFNWNRYFIDTAAAVRSHVQAQVVTALHRLGFSRHSRVPQIVPVSSDEMHRQACRDDEAPARLRNTATTGIPELGRALVATTRRAAFRWVRDVDQTIARTLGEDAYQDWLMLLEQEGNT